MKFLLIPWCSVFARMAGGGVWPQRPGNMAELLYALPFALLYDEWWARALAVAWAFAWFTTGHAVAFHMNNGVRHPVFGDATTGRMNTLSYVVNPFCKVLGLEIGGTAFCWIFMGLKGFLMHLPLGWPVLAAAVLWPLAYHIGNVIIPRIRKDIDGEMVAEFLSGAFSGLLIMVSL